jgi:hypothetical protein
MNEKTLAPTKQVTTKVKNKDGFRALNIFLSKWMFSRYFAVK